MYSKSLCSRRHNAFATARVMRSLFPRYTPRRQSESADFENFDILVRALSVMFLVRSLRMVVICLRTRCVAGDGVGIGVAGDGGVGVVARGGVVSGVGGSVEICNWDVSGAQASVARCRALWCQRVEELDSIETSK
eukprot:c19172_g1_i1.p1 GENE.c19172_g1_i1~~c19172_g1_i1.p1  ORF type:complete len:136 (-),score=34.32 c19172_g1_i1:195-602(-)